MSTFDFVVVGARCAGAAFATFAARAGAKVLIVDRDRLPSDQVLSTHTIHPPGVDLLDELGVGTELRQVTPTSPRLRLRRAEATVDISFANGRHELCPRRERLDGLLQKAAVAAGAELRDQTRATQVLFEDGRAVGVEIDHGGRRELVHASLIVGADGRHSSVAQQVNATEYMAYDAPRAMYWAYWPAPSTWHTDRFPFDMYIGRIGPSVRVIFQTDHDQLLIGSLPPVNEAKLWREDSLAALRRDLAEDPETAPLVADNRPASSVRGTLKERYFFRTGAGPGWALVGDAGIHKEFVVGDGITEALIQAKSLAKAVDDGGEDALQRWWRARDVEALPVYFWGQDEGSLMPPTTLQSLIFAKVSESEQLKRLMQRLPEHQCSPYDALPASTILPTVLGAVARGRFNVAREFVAQARRIAEYNRTLKERQQLLESTRGA